MKLQEFHVQRSLAFGLTVVSLAVRNEEPCPFIIGGSRNPRSLGSGFRRVRRRGVTFLDKPLLLLNTPAVHKLIAIAIFILGLSIAAWRHHHPPVQPRLDKLLAKGNTFLDRGLHRRARESFGRALSLDPGNGDARLGYDKAAVSYFKYGQRPSSTVVMRRAQKLINRAPNDPHLLAARGDIDYAEARYPRAAASYRRAISLRPSLVRARFALAVINDALGVYQDTVAGINETVEEEDNYCYYVMLAETHHAHGKVSRAVETYLGVVQRYPHYYPNYLSLTNALREDGRAEEALAYHAGVLRRLNILRGAAETVRNRRWVLNFRHNVQLASYQTKLDYARLSYALTAWLTDRQGVVETLKTQLTTPQVAAVSLIEQDIRVLLVRVPALADALYGFGSAFGVDVVAERLPAPRPPSKKFCGSIFHDVPGGL